MTTKSNSTAAPATISPGVAIAPYRNSGRLETLNLTARRKEQFTLSILQSLRTLDLDIRLTRVDRAPRFFHCGPHIRIVRVHVALGGVHVRVPCNHVQRVGVNMLGPARDASVAQRVEHERRNFTDCDGTGVLLLQRGCLNVAALGPSGWPPPLRISRYANTRVDAGALRLEPRPLPV